MHQHIEQGFSVKVPPRQQPGDQERGQQGQTDAPESDFQGKHDDFQLRR